MGQERAWIWLDGEECIVLSLNDEQVIVRYLDSSEDEDDYYYNVERFVEKTVVVK